MNGFFQVRRKFFSHALWTEERVFSRAEAFLDLLQLAAFVRTKRIVQNAMIPLERGEVCASERYLATRWKWSTSKVRAFLTLLEADRMLTKQKKQGVTVLKLCNYERYNPESPEKKAPINQGESSDEAGSKQIEEGEEGKQGEGAPPPAQASEPRPLCTLSQALEVGQRNKLSPDAIRFWWHDRNSKGWLKGGPGSPPIISWQSDLANGAWAEDAAEKARQAKALAPTGSNPKPARCL